MDEQKNNKSAGALPGDTGKNCTKSSQSEPASFLFPSFSRFIVSIVDLGEETKTFTVISIAAPQSV